MLHFLMQALILPYSGLVRTYLNQDFEVSKMPYPVYPGQNYRLDFLVSSASLEVKFQPYPLVYQPPDL